MLARRGVKVDKVLNFAIDDAILEERLTGRWIHPSSGRSYHSKFASPKVPGKDDVTGEPLIQCNDETAVVLKSRLEAFHKQTEPVIDYYSKKNIFANLHAEKPPQNRGPKGARLRPVISLVLAAGSNVCRFESFPVLPFGSYLFRTHICCIMRSTTCRI